MANATDSSDSGNVSVNRNGRRYEFQWRLFGDNLPESVLECEALWPCVKEVAEPHGGRKQR